MKGDTAVQEQNTETDVSSSSPADRLEDVAREHVQRCIHALLEEEVTEYWGERSPRGGQRWMCRRGPAMGTASRGGSRG